MNKDKIAHDIALIAVQEQLRIHREDNDRIGFLDVITNMVHDYNRSYDYIIEELK